jgi:exodeoxyribonuclease V alpha subunit
MQIENDYEKEVYNGDIGYIDDVNPEEGELTVRFDGGAVPYGFGELDSIVPAYAATIHKSQGSEYLAIVIPVLTQHYPMLAAQSTLYRDHPREAVGCTGGSEESDCSCGA